MKQVFVQITIYKNNVTLGLEKNWLFYKLKKHIYY